MYVLCVCGGVGEGGTNSLLYLRVGVILGPWAVRLVLPWGLEAEGVGGVPVVDTAGIVRLLYIAHQPWEAVTRPRAGVHGRYRPAGNRVVVNHGYGFCK